MKFKPKSKEDVVVNEAIQRMMEASVDDPSLLQSKTNSQETNAFAFTYKGFYVEVQEIRDGHFWGLAATELADSEVKQYSTKVYPSAKEAASVITGIIDKFRETRPNIGKATHGSLHG